MKKSLAALAGAACLLCSTAANATLYALDFTASGFGPGIFAGMTAPQTSVKGSISFTAASLGAPITSIDAVDLTIGGHAYTVPEIGGELLGNGYLFGALANGIGVTNYTSYAVDQGYDTWVTQPSTASFSEAAPAGADVREPGGLTLLGLGLAGLTLSRRRLAGLS